MHRTLTLSFFKIAGGSRNGLRQVKGTQKGSLRPNNPSHSRASGPSDTSPRSPKAFTVKIPREDPDSAYAADEQGNVSVSMEDIVQLGKEMGIKYPKTAKDGEVSTHREKENRLSSQAEFQASREFHRALDDTAEEEPRQAFSLTEDKSSYFAAIGEKLARDGLISNPTDIVQSMTQIGTVFIAVSPNYPLFVQRTTISQLLSRAVEVKVVSFVSNLAFVVAIDPTSQSYHNDHFIKWLQRNIATGTVFLTDLCSLFVWKAVDFCGSRSLGHETSRQCGLFDASALVGDPLQPVRETGKEDPSFRDVLAQSQAALHASRTFPLDVSAFGWNVSTVSCDSWCAPEDATTQMRAKARAAAFRKLFAQSGISAFAMAHAKRKSSPDSLQRVLHTLSSQKVDVVLCTPRTTASAVRPQYFMEEFMEPALDEKGFMFASITEEGEVKREAVSNTRIITALVGSDEDLDTHAVAAKNAHLKFLRESLEHALEAAGECAARKVNSNTSSDASGCYVLYVTSSLFHEENERVVQTIFKESRANSEEYTLWKKYKLRRVNLRSCQTDQSTDQPTFPSFLRESPVLRSSYRAFPKETASDGMFLTIFHVVPKRGDPTPPEVTRSEHPSAERFKSFFGFHDHRLMHLSCGTFSPTALLETSSGVIAKAIDHLGIPAHHTDSEITCGLKVLEKIDFALEIACLTRGGIDSPGLAQCIRYTAFAATHSFTSHRHLMPLWKQGAALGPTSAQQRSIHFHSPVDFLLFLYIGRLPSEIIASLGSRVSGWERCMYNPSSVANDLRVGSADERDVVFEKNSVHPDNIAHVVPGAVLLTTSINLRKDPVVRLDDMKQHVLQDVASFDEESDLLTISVIANIHYTFSDITSVKPSRRTIAVKQNRSFELMLPEVWKTVTHRGRFTRSAADPASEPGYQIDLSVNYLVNDPFVVAMRDGLCFIRSAQNLPYAYNEVIALHSPEMQRIISNVVREAALENRVEVPEGATSASAVAGRVVEKKEWHKRGVESEEMYTELKRSGIQVVEESVVGPEWR